ncbi:C4-dicarboxylate ABC transporter substrate-binding protein [Mesobaculum littorinae]|uniref:C4-dicarboxylate ABC transporter substrate-binding protein n=1 Tax=Mesobaculum littorinae TaxID=2486419 RepID=A0A438AHG7_9RHOB|nr:C4-dicarboxylate TRAP transporter substrate-binding protein [Mesobaculum littorinae]RVV98132.1 C4-dicarboxylate ABC transporter substrate-binding protein [Mesobaculum littorinae]
MNRMLATAASIAVGATGAMAETYTYGSWVPASDYINSDALPEVFRRVDEETNGEVQWELIAGGQLAGGVETFAAIQDGLMDAGVAAANYVPNLLPSIATLYGLAVPGDDPVAAAGAANEVMMLHCPSCLEETRNLNQVPMGGYASAPYMLICRDPITRVDQLQGLRVRASGAPLNIMEMAGASTVSVSLADTVSLLQRGGVDCTTGIGDWLKTFGYGDFAKNVTDFSLGVSSPIVGLMINRDVWNGFTEEQKMAHLRAAPWLSAMHTINNFVIGTNETLEDQIANNGVKMVAPENPEEWQAMMDRYLEEQRTTAIEMASNFGVEDPEAFLDAYDEALIKWGKLSEEIGTDVDKFAETLWEEVYSKVDLSTL